MMGYVLVVALFLLATLVFKKSRGCTQCRGCDKKHD